MTTEMIKRKHAANTKRQDHYYRSCAGLATHVRLSLSKRRKKAKQSPRILRILGKTSTRKSSVLPKR